MGDRHYVFLSARVHPGETNSSWVIQGLINFLVSDHPTAAALRTRYVFKIVPMLNPDGVVLGNYRCNVLGFDLNRHWLTPDRVRHAPVAQVKTVIAAMVARGRIPVLSCDFHGHSRRKSFFIFGCSAGKDAPPVEQVLPRLLAHTWPPFSFKGCRFVMEKVRVTDSNLAPCTSAHSYRCSQRSRPLVLFSTAWVLLEATRWRPPFAAVSGGPTRLRY
jgi:hypothetical protein